MGTNELNILALDPATKCGWAHSNGAGGVWDLSIARDESSGMRLIRFEGKLREIIKKVPVDVIVYETPTVASGKKANMNGLKLGTKLQAIIERLTETLGCLESKGYNLQTIKSHAGVRKKDELVAKAKQRFGFVEDDNHADALWLLDLAKKELVH